MSAEVGWSHTSSRIQSELQVLYVLETGSAVSVQGWDEYCKHRGGCGKHPKVPNQAYLINLPEDQAKLKYSQRLLAELGFNVEVIEGTKSVQVYH